MPLKNVIFDPNFMFSTVLMVIIAKNQGIWDFNVHMARAGEKKTVTGLSFGLVGAPKVERLQK